MSSDTAALSTDKPHHATRVVIIEAAKTVLRERGYAGMSTREVAAKAGVPLSQIHYHFGSKSGLIVALFEYQNEQLLDRQTRMYGDPSRSLSQQWGLACDYLDEDLRSGYVRVYMELWAAGYADPKIAAIVHQAAAGWALLLSDVARRAEKRFGPLGPFTADDIGTLVGAAFVGAEAFVLLGFEGRTRPIRKALRKVGVVIAALEKQQG